ALPARAPLRREMHRRSAAGGACIDIRAMRDQPSNRAVRSLKRKRLQRGSPPRVTIHRVAQSQEVFGDVVGFLAVTLKMAERYHEFTTAGNRAMAEQPADERKVPGSPAGAEQGCRIGDPTIGRGHVHLRAALLEYLRYSHLSGHVILAMSRPVRATCDMQWRHAFAGRLHAGGKAGIRSYTTKPG